MKGFVEFKHLVLHSNAFGVMHHITMLLAPGGVVDLGDNILDSAARFIPAEIKTDRIHAIAEVSKVREQGDRPLRSTPPFAFNQRGDRGLE